MSIRSWLRRLNKMTPYQVVRRSDSRPVKAEVYDAIAHNSQAGWDAKFSDEEVLRGYVNKARMELYDLAIDAVIEHSGGVAAGSIVADVGCGPGELLRRFAERIPGCSLHGFDFSAATVATAQARVPTVSFSQHDVFAPPAMLADIVLCTETLEHLLAPDKAIARLCEWVKPGGLLLLTVPDGRLDTFKGHIQFWSMESWSVFIERHADDLSFKTMPINPPSAHVGNLGAVLIRRPQYA